MNFRLLPSLFALLIIAGCGGTTESPISSDEETDSSVRVADSEQDDTAPITEAKPKTFRDLVLEQQPAYLHDIMFNHGTMHARNWTLVPFDLYTLPDATSDVLLSKEAGSADVYVNDTVFCSFEDTSGTPCQSFMKSTDPRDHPVLYQLDFTDLVRLPDANEMWYKVSFGRITGWVSTPYAYEVDGTRVTAHTFSMSSHPFVLWEPVEENLTFESIEVPGTAETIPSQSISTLMDSLDLQLSADPEIRWVDGEPLLLVHLSPPLEWEVFCRQSEQPEPEISGLVSMFASSDEFSLTTVELGLGYCD